MEKVENNHHTFLDGRKCVHCTSKIADQAHASIKFCPRVVLPNCDIKCCKDEYHTEKNRLRDLPYNNIFNFHLEVNRNIAKLVAHKGEKVTLDDLKQYDIHLQRAAYTEIPKNHRGTYCFVGFCITQISPTNFKISTHENDFK